MNKTLKVKFPFFSTLEEGDTFELTEDKKFYVCKSEHKYEECGMKVKYNSETVIPAKSAKELIENGSLYSEEPKVNSFVNVFDEIDNLLKKYEFELSEIDNTMKDSPECLKVEKLTVLRNLIQVLSYLKSLKK